MSKCLLEDTQNITIKWGNTDLVIIEFIFTNMELEYSSKNNIYFWALNQFLEAEMI